MFFYPHHPASRPSFPFFANNSERVQGYHPLAAQHMRQSAGSEFLQKSYMFLKFGVPQIQFDQKKLD